MRKIAYLFLLAAALGTFANPARHPKTGARQPAAGNATGRTGQTPGITTVKNTVNTAVKSAGKTTGTTAATWYVDPQGDDGNDGSAAHPWATLHHACSRVHTPGDVIHLQPGTYREQVPCELSAGISVEGADTSTTHLLFNFFDSTRYTGAIVLASPDENTPGNQHISGIDFGVAPGDSVSTFMMIKKRGQVAVHDCKFSNAKTGAVFFYGRSSSGPPGQYARGNTIFNCHFYDCQDRQSVIGHSAGGDIGITGQESMSIHDNLLRNTGRPQGHNGNIIGAVQGWNKGIHYYRNMSFKPLNEGNVNNFGIESWYDQGGWEIDHNTFDGGGNAIDISFGGVKGAYPYSFYIHHNNFTAAANPPFDAAAGHFWIYSVGIQFEGEDIINAGDAEISYNHFKNIGGAVMFTQSHGVHESVHDVWIHNNLCQNLGYAGGEFHSFAFELEAVSGTSSNRNILIDSIFIYNNTIIGAGKLRSAVFLNAAAPYGIANIFIRNNILKDIGTAGSYSYLTWWGNGTISNVVSEHNLLFGNMAANDTTRGHGQTVNIRNFRASANMVRDPRLGANFAPVPGSPAINAASPLGFGKNIGFSDLPGK